MGQRYKRTVGRRSVYLDQIEQAEALLKPQRIEVLRRLAEPRSCTEVLEGSDGKTRLTVVQSGFDPANPPYPGWTGWLGGLAPLRRYHELPQWRTIWRQIEIAGVPGGMFSFD